MPSTVGDHWEYTKNEWSGGDFAKLLDALPKNINVIYDIGANVGGWSEIIHRRYQDAEIHAFEPVRMNYEALVNYVPYVIPHKYGIYYGATESLVCSRTDIGGNIGAFFLEQVDAGPPIVKLNEVIALKELEKLNIPKPDLAKLDVEGAEENILEFSEVLRNCPNLIIEWHPNRDPYEFFKQFLPHHKIVVDLQKMQFLLST